MEPDGKSRVYTTSGGSGLVYDSAELIDPGKVPWKSHEESAAIMNRMDFRAVHYIGAQEAGYGVTEVSTDTRFEVECKSFWIANQDQELIKALEKRTGKKGLTIVTS